MKKLLSIIILSIISLGVYSKEKPRHREEKSLKIEITEQEMVAHLISVLERTAIYIELELEEAYQQVYGKVYEEPVRPEKWMFEPFIKEIEEPFEVEEWMTKPFNHV